jgi:hypothetical protein
VFLWICNLDFWSVSEKAYHHKPLTLAEVQKEAKAGGLVVGGWSSHAFTLNKNGLINNVNVGVPKSTNNIWDPQYALPKSNKFYLIYSPIKSSN